MYTVAQLQALDFLLKRILDSRYSPLYNQPLKLVIEYSGCFWCGDFVEMLGRYVKYESISDSGSIAVDQFGPATSQSGIAVLETIWSSYKTHADKEVSSIHWINPFDHIKEPALLLDTLLKIVDLADWQGIESPLRPHLLNARTLDGKLQLPFLLLQDEPIRLVSLINTGA